MGVINTTQKKRGDVVFCFIKENGLKWGGGPQLCQERTGVVLCLAKENGLGVGKFTRPILDSTTFLVHHRCGVEGTCISGCSRVNLRDPQDLCF